MDGNKHVRCAFREIEFSPSLSNEKVKSGETAKNLLSVNGFGVNWEFHNGNIYLNGIQLTYKMTLKDYHILSHLMGNSLWISKT